MESHGRAGVPSTSQADEGDPLPLLVMVGGAPGSGKTTLAALLAEHLDVPWLSRDPFSRGIRRTEGVMPDAGRSWALWYETVALLLRNSVSLVIDQTMYRGIAEPDIRTNLLGLCEARLVHCHAPDALERFTERERTRNPETSVEYQRVLGLALAARDLTVDPPDLEVEMLRVDTSEGYDPALADIVEFVGKGS